MTTSAGQESGGSCSSPSGSPDLSPLDFSVWAEISKRMRSQEAKWAAGKKETRAQYISHLRRTAVRLPPSYIKNVIGNLAKRTRLLEQARGGHFAEGGM